MKSDPDAYTAALGVEHLWPGTMNIAIENLPKLFVDSTVWPMPETMRRL
jgi:hypothetical protein